MTLFALLVLQSLVPTSAGIHELTLARENASEIVYTLSLPAGFEPETPRPLVIALHYAGMNHTHYGRGILTDLVEPGLRSLDAVIAAPDSPRGGWSDGEAESLVIDLLDFLTEHYRVDPHRVVLTGYSMGGMGTWHIASRNPGRFTAAIPMAGAPRDMGDVELRALVNMPLYAIHSRADSVVPIAATERAIATLRAENAGHVGFAIANAVPHYNVPGFVPYLRKAASWLQQTWTDQ